MGGASKSSLSQYFKRGHFGIVIERRRNVIYCVGTCVCQEINLRVAVQVVMFKLVNVVASRS